MSSKIIKRTDSRDTVQNFSWNKTQATIYPDFSYQSVINMINNDPVARGAVIHFVDKCMEGDYAILKRETSVYDRNFEMTLDEKYQFRTEIIRKIFLLGKLFNNVYIEIIKDTNNETKMLNILDSMNIEPITKPNGDPIKYKSKIPNPATGQYPEWTSSEVVWVKFNDRGIGFAPVDLRALWENLNIKEYVRRYVAWLWKTGQYRLLYNFRNSSNDDIKDWMAYNRKHDENFQTPFITKGEMEAKVLRDMKEASNLVEMLSYLDNQTLILLRVPPVDAGIPDASGRSNADAQSNNLDTAITSFKKVIEDKINFELFPKINKSNNLFKFAPNDRFCETQLIDNIQKMKASGFTNEACEEYLKDRGLFFSGKVFNDIVVEQPANPKEKNNFISRAGKTEGVGNQPQDTPTTRPDQL